VTWGILAVAGERESGYLHGGFLGTCGKTEADGGYFIFKADCSQGYSRFSIYFLFLLLPLKEMLFRKGHRGPVHAVLPSTLQ